MHRSGTSVTASLVRNWGAYPGAQNQLIAPDRWNPTGYWEYLPLVRFNLELLYAVDSRTMIPPGPAAQYRLAELSVIPKYREHALALLERMQENKGPWFWKDPRVSILLSFWQEIWRDITFIMVVRKPSEVAQSLIRRTPDLPGQAALLNWQQYTLESLRMTARHVSKIVFDYNHLVADPDAACQRLYTFLDNELGSKVQTNCQDNAPMTPLIDQRLYRNRLGEQMTSREQEALHRIAAELASEERKVVPDLRRLRPADWWREYLQGIRPRIDRVED